MVLIRASAQQTPQSLHQHHGGSWSRLQTRTLALRANAQRLPWKQANNANEFSRLDKRKERRRGEVPEGLSEANTPQWVRWGRDLSHEH